MSIENARADLSRLEHDIERMHAKLAEMEAQAARVRIYMELAAKYDGGDATPSIIRNTTGALNASRHRIGGRQDRIISTAADLIGALGVHMRTTELREELAKRDLVVTSDANLASVLSRSQKFKSNRKLGWSLISAEESLSDETPSEVSAISDHNANSNV